jgi:hypothetical protein
VIPNHRPSTAEQHQAYREGRCVDCRTAPYSAGRPRCEPCHSAAFTTTAPQAPTKSNSWLDMIAAHYGDTTRPDAPTGLPEASNHVPEESPQCPSTH